MVNEVIHYESGTTRERQPIWDCGFGKNRLYRPKVDGGIWLTPDIRKVTCQSCQTSVAYVAALLLKMKTNPALWEAQPDGEMWFKLL